MTKIDDQAFSCLKEKAACKAAEFVQNGMVVGLGTGSTAWYAVKALGEKVRDGLRIVGIPTSEETARHAQECGITLTSFAIHPRLDITIDGADEVEVGSLDLIKGLGGALLREKIVAVNSNELIIVVDESKMVEKLGNLSPLPVEVISFGWETTRDRLKQFCTSAELRLQPDKTPYCTDSNNYILDCRFPDLLKRNELVKELNCIVGVVETGLFLNLTTKVVIGSKNGIQLLKK